MIGRANIEGLIVLQFEEDSIGYMYYDEIIPEMYETGCFQDELLVLWFENSTRYCCGVTSIRLCYT